MPKAKKKKKVTSFRVDEGVLRDLAALAVRLTKRTGMGFTSATLVDAALTRITKLSDDEVLIDFAAFCFGIRVLRTPEELLEYAASRSVGGDDRGTVLIQKSLIPVAHMMGYGVGEAEIPKTLPGKLVQLITRILQSVDSVERSFRDAVKRKGKGKARSKLLAYIEELIRLGRGGEEGRGRLACMRADLLLMDLAGDKGTRKAIETVLGDSNSELTLEEHEHIKWLLNATSVDDLRGES